ncbi:hypothetical protein Drorol1_Dr00011220 [Drosera rotundifolia]
MSLHMMIVVPRGPCWVGYGGKRYPSAVPTSFHHQTTPKLHVLRRPTLFRHHLPSEPRSSSSSPAAKTSGDHRATKARSVRYEARFTDRTSRIDSLASDDPSSTDSVH